MADMFRQKKGFTLSELLVAATILAILAGVALPLAKIAVKREKEIELQRSLRLIREAVDEYKRLADEKKIDIEEDTDGYPPNLEILVKGVQLMDEGQGSTPGQGPERTQSSKKSQGSTADSKIIKFLRRIPKDPMTNSFDWQLRSSQDAFDSSSWGGQNVFDVYTKSNKTAIDGTKYKDW
jgi:general secretion pathway protein G